PPPAPAPLPLHDALPISLTLPTRERLACAAYARTAAYDQAVSAYFSSRAGGDRLPARLDLHFERRLTLRYGENPHQQAAFYVERSEEQTSELQSLAYLVC